MSDEKKKLQGEKFQQKSKNIRGIERSPMTGKQNPELYKIYQNAISRVQLPKPEFSTDTQFWDIIRKRHTSRSFSIKPISIMDLGLLLFGMSGLTRVFPNFAFRTVPSAGARFPIEIYPIVNKVSEVEKGVYHYDMQNHDLVLLKGGDFRKSFTNASYGQRMVSKSAVIFVMTAMIDRTRNTYGERSYRYIYLDCGHIGQNLYLAAEALGLNTCVIGRYYDDEINDLLDLDENEEFAIYMAVVGKRI
ncbi:MAG: SagB/ThcOx family dehydrogenase [Promethearchaeota archaeon]|jgi:SagB-type dehydrogenase family enzyme